MYSIASKDFRELKNGSSYGEESVGIIHMNLSDLMRKHTKIFFDLMDFIREKKEMSNTSKEFLKTTMFMESDESIRDIILNVIKSSIVGKNHKMRITSPYASSTENKNEVANGM